MIISASYKTDIPTFYGEWFVNRLRAGYCKMVNTYNRRAYRVDLRPEAVQGIVFWTKNLAPFFGGLLSTAERGYPFVVQYTINGYPRALETNVIDADRAIESARRVTELYGPHRLVWRYDTILVSDLTPLSFHRENFARLAARLEGATDEVVISFAQIYKKTKRNLDVASQASQFTWTDPTDAAKRDLVGDLVQVAKQHGMGVSVCAQRAYAVEGANEARCIDARRFARVLGHELRAKVKGNRPECECYESRDIGEYDTCPHGCVYCYSVQERAVALERFRAHDPNSEFLFPPPAGVVDNDEKKTLPLFRDD